LKTDKPMKFTGRIWLIKDVESGSDGGNGSDGGSGNEGGFKDDIDTDMIFHNAHLHITDMAEMGQHAFGNLEGYSDFAEQAREDDIVVVGRNFGSGSSRQQAVDCFAALGVSCIIAGSYGAIYKRNAINSGFPILTLMRLEGVEHFDTVEVDLGAGEIRKDGVVVGEFQEFPKVQMGIYQAGNIFEYGKTL